MCRAQPQWPLVAVETSDYSCGSQAKSEWIWSMEACWVLILFIIVQNLNLWVSMDGVGLALGWGFWHFLPDWQFVVDPDLRINAHPVANGDKNCCGRPPVCHWLARLATKGKLLGELFFMGNSPWFRKNQTTIFAARMDTQVHRSTALLCKSCLLLRRSAHMTGLKMAETELTV